MTYRLLDLFCGQGGAGEGYARAGFDVTGVDLHPMPRNPHRFVQADALEYLAEHGHEYDVIHASPPCQAYTKLRALHPHIQRSDMVATTRRLLGLVDALYVMENVPQAPLDREHSVLLCGEMFGLRTLRHRLFENNWACPQPEHVTPHSRRTITQRNRKHLFETTDMHVTVTGNIGSYVGREAMGIEWMDGEGLSQAIPPAYTQYIGTHPMRHLRGQR